MINEFEEINQLNNFYFNLFCNLACSSKYINNEVIEIISNEILKSYKADLFILQYNDKFDKMNKIEQLNLEQERMKIQKKYEILLLKFNLKLELKKDKLLFKKYKKENRKKLKEKYKRQKNNDNNIVVI